MREPSIGWMKIGFWSDQYSIMDIGRAGTSRYSLGRAWRAHDFSPLQKKNTNAFKYKNKTFLANDAYQVLPEKELLAPAKVLLAPAKVFDGNEPAKVLLTHGHEEAVLAAKVFDHGKAPAKVLAADEVGQALLKAYEAIAD
jgi:hypothetical protein